jgi:hypothetical protein
LFFHKPAGNVIWHLSAVNPPHGTAFGHIEMIRVVKGQIQRLRLHQVPVRDKVIKVTDLKDLQELYEQLG